MNAVVRIMGIDPGSRVTGYGILDARADRIAYVTSGCIRTSAGDFAARLEEIFRFVGEMVAAHRPAEIVIERVFVHRNADSALKLGQARAAALCATFAAALPIHEYAPREIKQAVVGRGSADKQQVQHMVRALLRLRDPVQADAADALAAAICHAHQRAMRHVLQAGSAR